MERRWAPGAARLAAAALVVEGLYYIGHGWLPVPMTVDRVVYYTVNASPLTLYPLDLAVVAGASSLPLAWRLAPPEAGLAPALLGVLGYTLLYAAGIPWGPALMGLAALLGLALYARILGARGVLESASLALLAIEPPALAAGLSYFTLGHWAGPAWAVVARERAFWAPLEWASITLLPLAGLAAIPGLLLGRWGPLRILQEALGSKPRTPRRGGGGIPAGGRRWGCLLVGAALAVAAVVLPHLPSVDPGGRPVSVDTFYYLAFLRDAAEKGLRAALGDYSGMARPAYLAVIYLAARRLDPVLLLDVVHPIVAGAALVAASYYAAESLGGPGAGCPAAILAGAGRGLVTFIAGGFQANSAALPLALLALATPPTRPLALGLLLAGAGLIHPWTLAVYTLAYPLAWRSRLAALAREDPKRLAGPLAALALAWASSEAAGRLASTSPAGAVAGVAARSLLAPGGPLGVYRALTLWTWGSQSSPAILLAATLAPPGPLWAPLALVTPLLALVPAIIAHRLLLEAPLEAMAGHALSRSSSRLLRLAVLLAVTARTLEVLSGLTPLPSGWIHQV